MMNKPQFPVYIISKGRHDCCLTADFFLKDGLDFCLVIEPQQVEDYARHYPREILRILPFSNLGLGSMPARNWCWEDSLSKGFARHWIFDDNIHYMGRLNKGKRLRCSSVVALAVVEEFTRRYENIGLSGFNYEMFVLNATPRPFYLNTHLYSALLIDNYLPFRWRMKYNEDTDLCLQVLTRGLCTVVFNAFHVKKQTTLTMKGGNSDQLYKEDGRLKMARSLEAMWPDHVEVKFKFGRPQHHVNWKKYFKQPLKRRADIDFASLPTTNEFGLKLRQLGEIKSPELRAFYEKNK